MSTLITDNHSVHTVAPKNPVDIVLIPFLSSSLLSQPVQYVCEYIILHRHIQSNAHTNIIHIIVYSVLR